MICLSVFVEDYKLACTAIEAHGNSISFVELRCDSGNESLLAEAANAINRPLIITCRPYEHGGKWKGSEADRARFLEKSLRHRPLYLDVELGTAAEDLIERYPHQDMILSFHGSSDSSTWGKLLERAFRRGAHAVKFVPIAKNWKDNLEILDLVHNNDASGKRLIAHCSGVRGIYSRILAPAAGSMLAYCCASKESMTSGGQFTIDEALSLYRLHDIRRSWRVYGIAGLPVAHSRSPVIMNRAFSKCSIDAVYLPFEVDDFNDFITFAHEAGLAGLSITAPYKTVAFETSVRRDDAAEAAGSANTLVWSDEGYHAANTDGIGFVSAVERHFGKVSGNKFLILGAGGAARGVARALKHAGAFVSVTGRNTEAVNSTANKLGIEPVFSSRDEPAFDFIVNGTPIRLQGDDSTGLMKRWLQPGARYIDMNYADKPSWFLDEAERIGCETLDGLPMLLAQAEEQFRLWTGVKINFSPEDSI